VNQQEKPTRKLGKPPFCPTEDQRRTVEMMAAMGVPQENICDLIYGRNGKPIDPKTLRKYFSEELATAAMKANIKVANALFRMATDPKGGMKSVTAQIFWLKTRARWKETSQLDLTSQDGSMTPRSNVMIVVEGEGE
jgi:hypothetical protein